MLHYGGMTKKEIDEQCLDLVHDLIEVLARGIIRIERQLDRSRHEEPRDA